jgi:cell wall-associated NlpC family hydrolase
MVLALPAGTALASPSASDAQKKLDALNKQFDQADEKYNKTSVDLAAAKKKLDVSNQQVAAEQTTYQQLRQQIVNMAASAYKTGNLDDVSTFLAAKNPQDVLDQAAVFTELTKNRSSVIGQFLQSVQRLQLDHGAAQEAYAAVKRKQDSIKAQKTDLEKQISQQKTLLKKLGISNGGGGSKSSGATYNGPASGNARTALSYAYAQIGCNYHYGATGPCSAGFDCSGLTMKSWAAAGVSLPRTAREQYYATKRVSAADKQPGDLIFFSGLGHVAMVVNGSTGIESPHTGAKVRTFSLSSRSDITGYGRP